MQRMRTRNGRMAMGLAVVVAGMVGLSFASVPLYRLFCQVTGYGGTPKTENVAQSTSISERTIKVRFDANTNPKLPWRFMPQQKEVEVRLGEQVLAFYEARNLSATTTTGTATFNVTPFKAAPYFSKIDCFCFTEQSLEAGQEVPMPVQFYVDPEIFEDPGTKEVKTITLSYTFHRTDEETAAVDGEQTSDGSRDKPEPGES